MNKTNVMLLFIGSVGLILVAIIFTSIINKTKSNAPSGDIRARASAKSTTRFLCTVQSYNPETRIMTVTEMKFADSAQGKSLGTWEVSIPASVKPEKFPPGTKIEIGAAAASLDITKNTVTALELRAQ